MIWLLKVQLKQCYINHLSFLCFFVPSFVPTFCFPFFVARQFNAQNRQRRNRPLMAFSVVCAVSSQSVSLFLSLCRVCSQSEIHGRGNLGQCQGFLINTMYAVVPTWEQKRVREIETKTGLGIDEHVGRLKPMMIEQRLS